MQEKNIEVGIHFIPVHKHTYFSDGKIGDMSITNKIVEEILTLPLHSEMNEEFVKRIIDSIVSFFK